MNKRISFIFRLLVSIALLFALFRFVPYTKLIEIARNSNKIYIFYSFFIFFLCQLIGALRWKFLLYHLGIKASYPEVFYSFFSGLFFNLFFPSFIAQDVFRGFDLSCRYKEAGKVTSSVFMDRFSGAAALLFLVFFSFFTAKTLIVKAGVLFPLVVFCLIIGFSSFLIFSKTFFLFFMRMLKEESRARKRLISFHNQLYFFKNNLGIFIQSLLFFSLPIQILTSLSFFVSSKAFGLDIGIIYFLILVPIVMMIAVIPITIAGAGTREVATVYFFSLVGVENSISLGISFLNLVFSVIMGIMGGALYVSIYHRRLQSHS